uniref:Uncharacterized protein n=1 Tax=Arundo donax TaxID=35708 RepID=A0A0A9AZ47_ARUDO
MLESTGPSASSSEPPWSSAQLLWLLLCRSLPVSSRLLARFSAARSRCCYLVFAT